MNQFEYLTNNPYNFIQNFTKDTLWILLYLFNTICNHKTSPQHWGNSIVISVNKLKNKFAPEVYCTISMLNTICKLLEKTVNLRLIWFLEQSDYFTLPLWESQKKKKKTHTTVYSKYTQKFKTHTPKIWWLKKIIFVLSL